MIRKITYNHFSGTQIHPYIQKPEVAFSHWDICNITYTDMVDPFRKRHFLQMVGADPIGGLLLVVLGTKDCAVWLSAHLQQSTCAP